jgi:hypothetical protein
VLILANKTLMNKRMNKRALLLLVNIVSVSLLLQTRVLGPSWKFLPGPKARLLCGRHAERLPCAARPHLLRGRQFCNVLVTSLPSRTHPNIYVIVAFPSMYPCSPPIWIMFFRILIMSLAVAWSWLGSGMIRFEVVLLTFITTARTCAYERGGRITFV